MQSPRREHICFASVYGEFSPLMFTVHWVTWCVRFSRFCLHSPTWTWLRRRRCVTWEQRKASNSLINCMSCQLLSGNSVDETGKNIFRTAFLWGNFQFAIPSSSDMKYKTGSKSKCAWKFIEYEKNVDFMAKRATHSFRTVSSVHSRTHRTKNRNPNQISTKTKAYYSEAAAKRTMALRKHQPFVLSYLFFTNLKLKLYHTKIFQ